MSHSLIYNNQLSAAYTTGSVTSSQLRGKPVLLLHNSGTLYKDVEKRLLAEGAEVQLFDYINNESQPDVPGSDIVIIAVEWDTKPELLRLKTVTKEMYEDFFQSQVLSMQSTLKAICEKKEIEKAIVLLPSFAFEVKYGFTLYGMAAERIILIIDTIIKPSGIQTIEVHYGKTLKAKAEVNADISHKTGLLRHVLLREQVAALVAFLCGPIGNSIKQDVINIGLSAE